jgi:mono/diheme cytochrome c family protein
MRAMFRRPTGRILRLVLCAAVSVMISAALGACYPNPSPVGLTPIPSLAPGVGLTPVGAVTAQPTSASAATAAPAATAPASAAATAAPTQAAAGGAAPAGNAQAGQGIFATNCSPCHGQNGQGGGVGPKLAKNTFVQPANAQKVHDTIANGRPGTAMPAWSQAKGGALSDTQINDVIAYLYTLQ